MGNGDLALLFNYLATNWLATISLDFIASNSFFYNGHTELRNYFHHNYKKQQYNAKNFSSRWQYIFDNVFYNDYAALHKLPDFNFKINATFCDSAGSKQFMNKSAVCTF